MMKLSWVAYYENGNPIREGTISYGNLDRTGLREFSLVNEKSTVATVKPTRDEVVFYRRRTFNATTSNQFVMYLLGARKKSGEVRLQIVMPDGAVIHDTEFRNQWYEPDWVYPQEQL